MREARHSAEAQRAPPMKRNAPPSRTRRVTDPAGSRAPATNTIDHGCHA